MADSFDIGVVGAGPAGLAVAIRARLAGLSVAVLEPRHPPIDRACGEGLLPDAGEHLAALGVATAQEHSSPLRGIRYLADGLAAEGRFVEGNGLGVRRTALHAGLVERAAALGADLRFGVAARALASGGIAAAGGTLAARVVVGADGRHSAVRTWAGLEGTSARCDRHAVRRHFETPPWSELVEVYWADQAEAYVTPVGGRVCVAMLWNGGASSFEGLLARFPALASRLRNARRAGRDLGASRLGARPRRVTTGCVALVGDAASGVDPITGEGVALAFRQAAALVEAVVVGDLNRYERAHRAISRRPRRMASLLLLLERSPALRRRVIAALAARRRLFASLLAVHTGVAVGRRAIASFSTLALAIAAVRPPAPETTRDAH